MTSSATLEQARATAARYSLENQVPPRKSSNGPLTSVRSILPPIPRFGSSSHWMARRW